MKFTEVKNEHGFNGYVQLLDELTKHFEISAPSADALLANCLIDYDIMMMILERAADLYEAQAEKEKFDK